MARVNLGELTPTTFTALAPPTRVEHGAFDIELARLGAALTFTTLVAGEALDDRRGADPNYTVVRDAGIVVLAPAVTMVFAGRDACPAGADFSFGAAFRTRHLSGNGPMNRTESKEGD